MFYIKVILDKSINSLFHEYRYLVKESDYELLNIGSVVEVKFGHTTRKAFVTYKGVFNKNEARSYNLKEINRVINYDVLTTYQLYLYHSLRKKVVNDHFSILNSLIKNNDKVEQTELKMRVELAYEFIKEEDLNDEDAQLILELIKQNKILTKRKLNTFFDVKASKIKKLIDMECIKKTEVLYQYKTNITKIQENTYEKTNIFDSLEEKVNVLIPGSKRTNIYNELFDNAIKNNKQLLVLVPEVGATYDLLSFIGNEYEQNCIIINSKTTNKEMQYYGYLIRENLVNIIIGTKKSIFLPFVELETIIVESAHDFNYYNNFAPYNNLINLLEDIKVQNKILISDTPNMITYTKALKGIYNLIEYQSDEPNITITQINDYEQVLSVDNLLKVKELINNDQKILIYYNYQGYASFVKCNKCGTIKTCPNCNRPLRYYQADEQLGCSTCNIKFPNYNTCKICHTKDDFSTGGIGIEKVLEVLKNYFADDIVYMDAAKIAKASEYNNFLKEVETKHVVLATQAITNLNIVKAFSYAIIVNSDVAYYSFNPYLVEKTYQDVFAIASKVNEISVQTKLSNTHMYDYLNTYKDFYQKEMEFRKLKAEIPYYNICIINTFYNNIDILKHFNLRIEEYFKSKNIMIENYEVIKASKFNYNYKQTLRIKYKNEDLKKVFKNISDNAIKQKIVIEIKDQYNNYL